MMLTYGYQVHLDELDNPWELADTFAIRSRMCSEEYEARLDALGKSDGLQKYFVLNEIYVVTHE